VYAVSRSGATVSGIVWASDSAYRSSVSRRCQHRNDAGKYPNPVMSACHAARVVWSSHQPERLADGHHTSNSVSGTNSTGAPQPQLANGGGAWAVGLALPGPRHRPRSSCSNRLYWHRERIRQGAARTLFYPRRDAVGALVCVTHPSCRLKPAVGTYSKSQPAFFATTMNAFEIIQSAGARRSAAIPTR